MRTLPGSPGTLTSLFLRTAQCVFAAGSIAFMRATSRFSDFSTFWFLIGSMNIQVGWSFVLALLDGIALVKKAALPLHDPYLIFIFVVGDRVTVTISLAAASASAGIAVFYFNDFGSALAGKAKLYFNDLGDCKFFGGECQNINCQLPWPSFVG